MSDIGDNYPINPIWRSKPGERPGQRRRIDESTSEREKRQQKDEQERKKPDDQPRIDDYA